jgi:outer membrane immunogenic protein
MKMLWVLPELGGTMIMKILFAAITALGLVGGSALAADLPAKAPITKAPPTYYNWAGFYIGGLATYGWADSVHCDAGACDPGIVFPAFNMNGWLGGVTAGYNFQSASWVFGIEADWSWGRVDGSSGDTVDFGCGRCRTSVDSIGTVRARLGYAFDRFLPYVTAGVAFTEYRASVGDPIDQEDSRTRATFTGGGGFEYAFYGNWSAKAEYLFIHKAGDFLYAPDQCARPGCFARTNDIQTVRFGVNYRFGGPLGARY